MLSVVVYHYVRDLPRTPFPRIKGLQVDDFRRQVDTLRRRFEMATLDSALDFLGGRYQPSRDLCLLTFDDGLMDHYTEVLPILRDYGVHGVFFVSTSCLERRVAAVHKNHFLMAKLGFTAHRDAFIERLKVESPQTSTEIQPHVAQAIYRMDEPETASFKYLINMRLDHSIRDRVLDALFAEHIGAEAPFADQLYMGWEELRSMQAAGMVIGGHSHAHPALSRMIDQRQRDDLTTCADILRSGLAPQAVWPFSYPYGEFNASTIAIVEEVGFDCGFTLELGANSPSQDLFRIKRIDTNDVPI